MPYDADIKLLTDGMRHKLALHAKKGVLETGMMDYSLAEIMNKLRAEVDELEEAVSSGNLVDVILESSDVANFAMFAVIRAHRNAAGV